MNFKQLSAQGPEFNFVEYFAGHLRASGWFADRFGNIKRHFCGDFFGEQQDDFFKLSEVLYYSDGIVEKRVWLVRVGKHGEFTAESNSLVGPATGIQSGSGLQLNYVMNVEVSKGKFWALKMNDYMFYQPDLTLHNSTEVRKWGIRIGNVSTQYYRHDGSQTCTEIQKRTTSMPFGKLHAVL